MFKNQSQYLDYLRQLLDIIKVFGLTGISSGEQYTMCHNHQNAIRLIINDDTLLSLSLIFFLNKIQHNNIVN